VLAALVATGAARGEEAASAAPGPGAKTRWLVEFKRQSTARGTVEETTKSSVKLEYFPEGPVTLLRLELPFPDEDTDFGGSPFNPRPGDVKVRAGFAAVPVMGQPCTTFVEVTFPTADPGSLGSGKYQLGAGVRTAFAPGAGGASAGGGRPSAFAQVQQVVSTGGDPARKDVNQTKIELGWRYDWPRARYAKATAKPVIDWVQDGKTGGVLEIEGGLALGRGWSGALMAGGLLWGKGTPGTYENRAEVKVSRRF
jgi:hypothetical protein